MRRTFTILLAIYIGTGFTLAICSLFLPYPAIDPARFAMFCYLTLSLVALLVWQFARSVYEGYVEALSGQSSTVRPNPRASNRPVPKPPAQEPSPQDRWLDITNAILGTVLIFIIFMAAGNVTDPIFYFLTAMLVVVLGALRLFLGIRQGYDQSVREERFAKGFCLTCGYDLRACAGPVCPECGTSFDREPS